MPFTGNNRFVYDEFIHYRIWSNNKYDLDMACGKFDRISRNHPYLRYTDLMIEVTCLECYATFTDKDLKVEAVEILEYSKIENLSLLKQKRIRDILNV